GLLANDNEGVPVLGGDASSDPEVFGVADHGLCSKGPVFFEVLLQPRALVVDRQLRVDTSGDDLGAEPAGVRAVTLRSKTNATWSGRPTSRWSRMTPSKNARPEAGRSKTRVPDTSNWRNANSY